jgi:hypothetical protein
MARFHENERPVMTASIQQVRQPLYTSSRQGWRRFETFLEPLRARIDAVDSGVYSRDGSSDLRHHPSTDPSASRESE